MFIIVTLVLDTYACYKAIIVAIPFFNLILALYINISISIYEYKLSMHLILLTVYAMFEMHA